MDFIVIFCTVSSKDEAKTISSALLKEKLAACISTVDKVASMFLWNGEVTTENELLLIIKTRRNNFEKIELLIKTLHSYNVPEIIALPIIKGSEDYLGWLEHETE